MKKYRLVTPKVYQDKTTGEQKTSWKEVGTMVVFPPTQQNPKESIIVELNMFPDLQIRAFEVQQQQPAANSDLWQQTPQQPSPQQQTQPQQPAQPNVVDDITPDDIPW